MAPEVAKQVAPVAKTARSWTTALSADRAEIIVRLGWDNRRRGCVRIEGVGAENVIQQS
jgi:hypothetical protein